MGCKRGWKEEGVERELDSLGGSSESVEVLVQSKGPPRVGSRKKCEEPKTGVRSL